MTLLDENMLKFEVPSIYNVVCKANNKMYIGESDSIYARTNNHLAMLRANSHDCKELQED